ncbi:TRAP transporter small permease [Fulvivirga sedimenti]|uniref:TRAP transporter small permease n=1 Tax=Fulvivirga sedimenti TaxID=2879465 RepID=A0A9X1HLH5_9BACT|nr:TRAP transporter small permease [Fulvivirga sedimenti]MCA6074091.1 TRAP transporter small permease [Fulvivirga sedimenti]
MRKTVDRFIAILLAILLALMTLDILYGVFTRYVLANQSEWTDELARYLMIWISILGAAFVSGRGEHIAIDLFRRGRNPHRERRLQIFISGVVLIFVIVVFLIGGIRYAYLTFSLGQMSASLNIPVGYVYLVLPLSGIFICYYKIYDLLKLIGDKNQASWK